MKNRLGITEGEWYYDPYRESVMTKSGSQHLYVAQFDYDWFSSLEFSNNAKLIADAGNTAQKCGLLPSELLEQRDELINNIEALLNYYGNDYSNTQDCEIRIKRLLKQIKEQNEK